MSLLCLNAYADVWSDPQSAPKLTAGAPAFDVTPYINQLQQAKNVLDATIKGASDDPNLYNSARAKYENQKQAIFNNMFNARRAQHAAVRFTVTRHCAGDAPAKSKTWGPHKYREGDVRITNPDPNQFVMIPGSGQVTNVKVDNRNGSAARYENARQEGNDFVVHLWIKGPDYHRGGGRIDVDLVAQYGYNNATLDRLTNADMFTFQKQVVDSVK